MSIAVRSRLWCSVFSVVAVVLTVFGIRSMSPDRQWDYGNMRSFVERQHFRSSDAVVCPFSVFYEMKPVCDTCYFVGIFPTEYLGRVDYIIEPRGSSDGFDRHATDWSYVWSCLLAFIAFCLAASGIYCFNDIHDAESDRQHPVKRMRPVASGAVSKRAAYAAMWVLWTMSFAVAALCSSYRGGMQSGLLGTLLIYIVMNVAYCLKLKQIALLDVFVIATGFVLRIVAGGLATGIVLSHWIVLTTFLLALFLAVAKRRDDVAIYEASGIKVRKSVSIYNLDFLNQAIGVLGSITIMCYILYTVSGDVVARIGSHYLYVTSVFVLAGILRYMQLTLVNQKSGSPTKVLLHDHFIHACIAGWIIAFSIILYA